MVYLAAPPLSEHHRDEDIHILVQASVRSGCGCLVAQVRLRRPSQRVLCVSTIFCSDFRSAGGRGKPSGECATSEIFLVLPSPFVTSEVKSMRKQGERDGQQPSGLFLGSEPVGGIVHQRSAKKKDKDDGKDIGGPGTGDTGDDDSTDNGDSDGTDKGDDGDDSGDANGRDADGKD
jgi:hypothetical protein